MQSELLRIPVELGGVPIFGFGVLLALWVVGLGGWLWRQTNRGMPTAEARGYLPVGLMVAVVIVALPRLFPGGLPIRGYGLMLLLAAVCGVGMAAHRARQNGLSADVIFSLSVWLFVCGILGARLFYVIEYWETRFATLGFPNNVVQMLMFTEGGLVVYGSLIGAALAFVAFCLRHKLPLLALADILAPSLVVGLALGRVGCLLNGCCYGGQCDRVWAVTFPMGSPAYQDQLYAGDLERGLQLQEDASTQPPRLIVRGALIAGQPDSEQVATINGAEVHDMAGAQRVLSRAYWSGEDVTVALRDGRRVIGAGQSLPVHPTQLYSAVNAALLAWITWTYYAFRRRDGEVIGLLLTLYPISRYLLEDIRTDEAAIFGTGLSISQNVSVGLLAAVAVYWFILLRRPPKLAFSGANPGLA